jgi:general secretion pathway protein E
MTRQTPAAPVRPAYDSAAFGQLLVERGDVDATDWRLAQEVARQNGSSELRALLDLGYVGEEALAEALADATHRPLWDHEQEEASLSDAVPLEFMQSNGVLVLDDVDGAVRMVVADPSDYHVWSAVNLQLGDRITSVLIGTQKRITQFLETFAAEDDAAGGHETGAIDISGELSALRELASEAPVVRFFNQAVERAMEMGASDIHIERFDRRCAMRYRVDGVLVDQAPPPLQLYEPLLCRIKIMSSLDIAERRRAQDGRIRMRMRGRQVDMRISIIPTMYGQDAAIRLQDRQRLADIRVEDLGFEPAHLASLRAISRKSHGILLITGPTGSGKTTTLYAILGELASTERKVVTVEDPVEYAMDGVNQIPVNPAIDLTFSNTLRHILRHDPDVILIGEIRDHETAEMAFQSALTGHMVLSTLHTNDVPSSFVRLIDMGVEPYLVNAAVEGVSAQRLLRRLCSQCRNQLPARETCRTCNGLGYRGRQAVMEFSPLLPEVKQRILQGAEEHAIRQALSTSGFRPMRVNAQRLIDDGMTDEAEVARVLGGSSDET